MKLFEFAAVRSSSRTIQQIFAKKQFGWKPVPDLGYKAQQTNKQAKMLKHKS
jgi:hypothetical protein